MFITVIWNRKRRQRTPLSCQDSAATTNITITHLRTEENAHFTHQSSKLSKFPTCFPCKTGLLSVSIRLIMTEQLIIFHHLDHAGSVVTSCSRVATVPTFPCKKICAQWLYAIHKMFQIVSSNNYDFEVLNLRRNHIFRNSFCKESFSACTLSSCQLRTLQFFVSFPERIPFNN